MFNENTLVKDVMRDPAFRGYGNLIFPIDQHIRDSLKLKEVEEILPWYNDIRPAKTVEIVNYMYAQAVSGHQIFFDIYTEEEKKKDPRRKNTGLFFFKGKENAPTALISAGGGFVYVGAMQDSFPQALELAKSGYNAFALIYRPGALTACEDLARAIVFLMDHQREMHINMDGYSLWGGSAGARMASWLGTYTTAYFGEKTEPKPAAVINQYTGLDEVTGEEPPTMAFVGTGDWIADYRVMKRRIQAIQANGTDADIRVYPSLPHGFGLGEGTCAEGWIQTAVQFWERNRKENI